LDLFCPGSSEAAVSETELNNLKQAISGDVLHFGFCASLAGLKRYYVPSNKWDFLSPATEKSKPKNPTSNAVKISCTELARFAMSDSRSFQDI
jgi:hypothetical protein